MHLARLRTLRPVRLVLGLALTLVGCDDEAAAPYAPDPVGADCVESDFAGAPLAGPGFTEGVYSGPTDQPLVASSTVLYIDDAPETATRFEGLMIDMMPDLMTHDGLLGLAFGGSERCGANRTLALWRDEASMMAFVTSAGHSAAMAAAGQIAEPGSRTVHWTLDPATEALTWEVGLARTKDATPFVP